MSDELKRAQLLDFFEGLEKGEAVRLLGAFHAGLFATKEQAAVAALPTPPAAQPKPKPIPPSPSIDEMDRMYNKAMAGETYRFTSPPATTIWRLPRRLRY